MNTQEELRVLRELARSGGHKALDNKQLKKILLETCGETTATINGTVVYYKIKHKHLGAGVYEVWLEPK